MYHGLPLMLLSIANIHIGSSGNDRVISKTVRATTYFYTPIYTELSKSLVTIVSEHHLDDVIYNFKILHIVTKIFLFLIF